MLIIGVLLCLAPRATLAQAIYSRSIEIEPLRVSADQMQLPLDKASALAHDAMRVAGNGSKGQLSITEEIDLKSGEREITISGHNLGASSRVLAGPIDELIYRFRVGNYQFSPDNLPIGKVEIWLSDYRRSVTVTGRDANEVDALSSALADDFDPLASWLGGPSFRAVLWLATLAGAMCFLGSAAATITHWLTPLRRLYLVSSASCFAISVGCYLLLSLGAFAGFAMFQESPDILVRLGPQLGLVSVILTIVFGLFSLINPYGRSISLPSETAVTSPKPEQSAPVD